MNKTDVKEYGISTLKGLIGAIPGAGTLLNEIAFEARSRIKQDRINSFVKDLIDYFEQNDIEISTGIDKRNLSDIFEEILISASKTSTEHKRKLLKQILLKQLEYESVDIDDTLRVIKITNEISLLQFKILSHFYKISDRVLKFNLQILELNNEIAELKSNIEKFQNGIILGSKANIVDKGKLTIRDHEKLIAKKKHALEQIVDPNDHKTYGVERDEFVINILDLVAMGLMFDFSVTSSIISRLVLFGISKLGRSFISYVSE